MKNRQGMHWTEDEDKRLREAYGFISDEQMTWVLGRSLSSIMSRRRDIALSKPPKRRPSRARYVSVLAEECLDAGVSLKAALDHGSKRRVDCIPRHKAWKRLVDAGYSLPGIGLAAGYDHTSILNGVRRAGAHDAWLAERD